MQEVKLLLLKYRHSGDTDCGIKFVQINLLFQLQRKLCCWSKIVYFIVYQSLQGIYVYTYIYIYACLDSQYFTDNH